MRTIVLLFVLSGLHSPLSAMHWAELGYFSNREITPEGNQACWSNDVVNGRFHTNGCLCIGTSCCPLFFGFVTQSCEDVIGLLPEQYGQVFQAGWYFSYPELSWPPDLSLLDGLAESSHTWDSSDGEHSLTTLIQFDGHDYQAAQYAEALIAEADTTWHLPWTSYSLPLETPLIHIEGVGRIKGIVDGRITVLCSDSLFIMGDLITVDTDVSSCTDEDSFGKKPLSSPHAIGLIGEKDIIIAATIENGFANGAVNPLVDCGLVSHPVITTCNQSRRDVVITAAILALSCSFEAEFWKTTASSATAPAANPQPDLCEGLSNQEITIWGQDLPICAGAASTQDRRGTIWLHGSLVQSNRGFIIRNPVGAWGNAWIGYSEKVYHLDHSLGWNPPPYWPDVELAWGEAPPLANFNCQILPPQQNLCNESIDSLDFLDAWQSSQLRVAASGSWQFYFPAHVQLKDDVNGVLLDTLVQGTSGALVPLNTWFDVAPFLRRDRRLWLSVQHEFEQWNPEGEVCSWHIEPDLAVEKHSESVDGFRIGRIYPNPFNPVTHIELVLPDPQIVKARVLDISGRIVIQLQDGPLPAGTTRLRLDGSSWSSGLYLLELECSGRREVRKMLLLE